jgi:acetyltransferase-like isoleucine patch superfamily enzyme
VEGGNAIVAANAVVTKDVAANTIVENIPATAIKIFNDR